MAVTRVAPPSLTEATVEVIQGSISETKPELTLMIPQYDLIRDVLAGQARVKSKTTTYLPKPNPQDKSEENNVRYQDYIQRALFYGVTGRTAEGLIGQIFLRDPIIELPESLEPMRANADGKGLTLHQLAKQVCGHVVPYGRAGLLSDFVNTDEQISVSQMKDVTPTIKFFAPWDIINWEVKYKAGNQILTFLILRELYEERELNTWKVETYERFRLYDLDTGVCRCRIFDRENNLIEEVILRDFNGNALDFIPFEFVGSDNNDSVVDPPPMYDMACLNIAHYRNSADYEESVYMLGQPTPVLTGLTETWVNDVLKGNVFLGSRAAIALPANADAKLIQVEPNTLAFEAMQHKEKQMIALGAKLVEQRKIEATATEIELNSSSDSSVLSSIADNVQLAMLKSLKNCQKFVGNEEEIKFTLNKNFDLTSLTAEEVRWLLEAWLKGAIPFTELRANLRRSGISTLPDEEAKAAITADIDFKKSVSVDTQEKSGSSSNPKPSK